MRPFDNPKVRHVSKEENVKADILSKLASMKPKGNNRLLIQETLKSSSIAESLPTLAIKGIPSWISPIIQFLRNGTQPERIFITKLKRTHTRAKYIKENTKEQWTASGIRSKVSQHGPLISFLILLVVKSNCDVSINDAFVTHDLVEVGPWADNLKLLHNVVLNR